jgi:RND family efflux transporter MFP subunit
MIIQVARAGARDAVFDVPAQIKDNAPLDPEVTVSLGKAAPTPLKRSADIAVTLGTNPNVTAKGRVREVSPRADPVTGTFAVRVRLIDPPETMRLGSTVTGRIQLDAVSGITIPATALVRADGKTAVWVFDAKTGTVSLRNIAVRASDATTVQVASGLNPGDVVVTAGVQALRPGQKVRLLESQS